MESGDDAGLQFEAAGMDALDIEAVRPDIHSGYPPAMAETGAQEEGGADNVALEETPNTVGNTGVQQMEGELVAHRSDPDASAWNMEPIESALGQEFGRGTGKRAEGRGRQGRGITKGDRRGGGRGRQGTALDDREDNVNADYDDPYQQMRDELEEVGAQWASEIQVPEFWEVYCHYASCSLKLDFGLEHSPSSSEEISLPLFASAVVPRKPGADNTEEFISHVGGSVWALDWCPQRPGWKVWHDKEFLAVGAHPASGSHQRKFGQPLSDYHRLGEPLYGKSLVQIWAFPSESDEISNEGTQDSDCTEPDQTNTIEESFPSNDMDVEVIGMSFEGDSGRGRGRGRGRARGRRGRGGRGTQGTPKAMVRLKNKARAKRAGKQPRSDQKREVELPKMVLAITHEGGVTWDVKWQPVGGRNIFIQFQEREFLRLGFLGVALGDGSVQVYDVPLPKVFSSIDTKGAPLVASMTPVFKCSELKSGGQKSIPLTLEWSTSAPHDLLLAGCHDGTVALWKFVPSSSAQESRPLLFFTADSFALRTIAWAPSDCGIEGEHIIATGGHSGHLKFWDLRDPFRPLWELRLSRGQILSMDWLQAPRCILVALDDGTLRTISLNNALSDTPVTGKPFAGTQAQGVQSYYCSSFAIWGIQVCRNTGLVAYCSADGSVIQFELSEKAIEKGGTRYREPHYLCGAFGVNKEKKALVIVSQDYGGPVQMKRSLTEWSFTPRSKRGFTVSVNQEMRASSIAAGLLPPTADTPNKKKPKRGKKKNVGASGDMQLVPLEEAEGFSGSFDLEDPQTPGAAGAMVCKEEMLENAVDHSGKAVQPPNTVEEMPSKLVAVHRVKWNPNKSSSGWVCYGGAAGVLRCKQVLPP